jgi:adenylate cyclase
VTADRESPAEIVDEQSLDLSALVEVVECNLLRGSPKYVRADVSERSGMSSDESFALWRALGFPTVGDDEQVFTDADVAALRNVKQLANLGELDDDVLRAMTRIIGQTFARLASWQGQLVLEMFARRPELLADGGPDRVGELMDQLTPLVGELHDYVWRRQLAAYFSRVASNAGAALGAEVDLAVGFVDMADFTAFTRRASEGQLRGVLDTFEDLATDIIGDQRGQIVKTIGDEVLYTADEPRAAAQIALRLIEAADSDDTLPPLRAGVAFGPVVMRLGDVFGQPVNIASRLTTVARTDSVLVDDRLAEQLSDDSTVVLHALRPVSVRGYRHLRAWRLRRAPQVSDE